jgi:hypothetical protein
MRRYYKIIAYTSYIGEELIKYHVREDNETNEEFDALLEQTLDECVDMWIGDHDYWTEYGFNTFKNSESRSVARAWLGPLKLM